MTLETYKKAVDIHESIKALEQSIKEYYKSMRLCQEKGYPTDIDEACIADCKAEILKLKQEIEKL